MTRRTTLAFAAGLLAGAGTVTMIAFAGDSPHYFPSEIDPMIRTREVRLAKAIQIAEKDTGGIAGSAHYDLDTKGNEITVVVYAGGDEHRVRISADDGKVLGRKSVPGALPGDAVSGESMVTDSGLRYYDITVGEGPQPKGRSSRVTVHYSGWLVDGTQFDSSVERGTPATFSLGGVIRGWTEGVGSMRVGGKRKLIIPYSLAYGVRGRPPQIPAKATLVFDIELLGIQE